ncbi:MAG TPA: hypothetical protein VFI92_05500 [Steroidobacteraceae bacterium]|nr:hypothetical protein [Steroidobacteraceae bacterium]
MHARIEHLLSLRDGEPVDAAVRAHVDGCARCRAALQDVSALRTRLRSLPAVEAGAVGWSDVQERRAARDAATRRRAHVARAAVAASIAVIAVAVSWRVSEAPEESRGSTVAAMSPLTAEEAVALDHVARLQTQSAALEEILGLLGDRPVVQRAGTALPIDTLEAQVQWLDHRISSSGGDARESEQLWRERVDTLNSLVRLRYVESQRIAM